MTDPKIVAQRLRGKSCSDCFYLWNETMNKRLGICRKHREVKKILKPFPICKHFEPQNPDPDNE
jgi:hypothetical protein